MSTQRYSAEFKIEAVKQITGRGHKVDTGWAQRKTPTVWLAFLPRL
jgi:transposase-like protein